MRFLLTIAAVISIVAPRAAALPVSTVIAHHNTTYFDTMIQRLDHHKKLDILELKSIHALHHWHSLLPKEHKSNLDQSLEHALLTSVSRTYDDCYWNETQPDYFSNPTANKSLLCSDVQMETGQKFGTSKELTHWIATVKMGIETLRKRVLAAWIEKSEAKVVLPLAWVPVYRTDDVSVAKRDMELQKRETTDADKDVEVLQPTRTYNMWEHAAINILCILGISRTICHQP